LFKSAVGSPYYIYHLKDVQTEREIEEWKSDKDETGIGEGMARGPISNHLSNYAYT